MHFTTRSAIRALATCLLPISMAAAADPDAIGRVVEAQVRPLLEEHDAPGLAVAVTVDGERYFFNYGVASRESGAPVTENTLFEIGSVSKLFTSTLGAYAAALGKLSLDDHPSTHLPELAGSPLDKATLLHLATYTAGGLPLQFPDSVADDSGAPAYFRQWQPEAAPGEQRRYSNPSIGLFGHLAASALDAEFADLIETTLFPALGLENSYIRVPDAAMAGYAWGYDGDDRPIRVTPGPFDDQAYGVKTSAADLIRFVEANIRPETLEQPVREAVQATHVGYFRVGEMVQGLGWEQFPWPVALDRLLAGNSRTMAMEANAATELAPPAVPSRPTLFGKTGSTNGFGAYVAFVPEKRIGVVLLANRNILIPARVTAAHGILEHLAE